MEGKDDIQAMRLLGCRGHLSLFIIRILSGSISMPLRSDLYLVNITMQCHNRPITCD